MRSFAEGEHAFISDVTHPEMTFYENERTTSSPYIGRDIPIICWT